MYEINNYESVKNFRKKIPLSEDLMNDQYLSESLEKVISDLSYFCLNDNINGRILYELLRSLYVLSFHNSGNLATKTVAALKKKANLYEILQVIIIKHPIYITLIYSILSNLTGDLEYNSGYLNEIEDNNKFFIKFLFDFLETYDYNHNLNNTIENIDKLIGFLFANHRLYEIKFDERSSKILMDSKTFIENILMKKFKHKSKHFECMRMNILSILFDYLNKRKMNPDYIADYIMILVDMIKKIVLEAIKNKKRSDNTIFYSFYQINDTKT